jgi:hypothetical protein
MFVSAKVTAMASHQDMDQIRAALIQISKKSTRRASTEFKIPGTTVLRVLHKRLRFKPYNVQLLQSLSEEDKVRRVAFCENFTQLEEDKTPDSYFVFSDEATFHVSGIVNKQNVRFWGSENPHANVEFVSDLSKVNVLCALSKAMFYGPFFFAEVTVTGITYLDMFEEWLWPQLQEDCPGLSLFQQDGAPPHFHLTVRAFLKNQLQKVGKGVGDQHLGHQDPQTHHLSTSFLGFH